MRTEPGLGLRREVGDFDFRYIRLKENPQGVRLRGRLPPRRSAVCQIGAIRGRIEAIGIPLRRYSAIRVRAPCGEPARENGHSVPLLGMRAQDERQGLFGRQEGPVPLLRGEHPHSDREHAPRFSTHGPAFAGAGAATDRPAFGRLPRRGRWCRFDAGAGEHAPGVVGPRHTVATRALASGGIRRDRSLGRIARRRVVCAPPRRRAVWPGHRSRHADLDRRGPRQSRLLSVAGGVARLAGGAKRAAPVVRRPGHARSGPDPNGRRIERQFLAEALSAPFQGGAGAHERRPHSRPRAGRYRSSGRIRLGRPGRIGGRHSNSTRIAFGLEFGSRTSAPGTRT
jgi:hypothetical protein